MENNYNLFKTRPFITSSNHLDTLTTLCFL